MEVVNTIIPMFAVIFLGWGAHRRGFITTEFVEPANRLVYYLSIPALIFSAIARTSFHEQFNGRVVGLTVLSVLLIYLAAFAVTRLLGVERVQGGVFIQCSGHGNTGYVGLPVAYYFLGSAGLAVAGIICGFVMITQNILSIIALRLSDSRAGGRLRPGDIVRRLFGNPVIIGSVAGMAVSLAGINLPPVAWRIIEILGGLAPPMALLLIGASLSLRLVRRYLGLTMTASAFKLVLLPLCAVLLFNLFGLSAGDYLPALILLCSPTATIVYVMAREMGGDAEFAVASISASTLLSGLTLIGWLTLVPGTPAG